MVITPGDRKAISHIPMWVQRIIAEVCTRHHVPPREVVSPTRVPTVVRARYEAMHAIMARGKTSAACVGRWFFRDNTTVNYALARHAEMTDQQSLSGLSLEKKRQRYATRETRA